MSRALLTSPRVLLVAPSLGGGGAEQQALRLANALDLNRFHVSVAAFRSGGAYEERLTSSVSLSTLVPDPVVSSSTLTAIQAAGRLRRLVKSERPDVVVAFHTSAGLVARWATRGLPSVKLVVSVQNTLSHEARESKFVTRFITRMTPSVLKHSDAVVALSHGVAHDLTERWGISRSRVSVIYNAGFDEETRCMAQEPVALPSAGGHILVSCGRLVPQKGYSTLLHAFAELSADNESVLWILGDGPDRKALEKLAAELRVSDRVSFLGFQRNPYPYMKAADIFVLSSRYEGFANVIAEAMWLGVPVVASDCEHGPREILGADCSGGVLFPVGDHRSLAASLDHLLQDDDLRSDMGKAAVKRAALFSDKSSATRYQDVFASVLWAVPRRCP